MIPATTNGGGQCFAFPDVCKTPIGSSTPPIPYPNIGMCSDLKTSSCPGKIRICKKFAGVVGSEIPMSSGDEAGVAGGVIGGSNKKKVVYTSGYPKVLLQGKVAAFLTSLTTQNNANIVGAQVAPSQTKVLYSPVPVAPVPGIEVAASATSRVEEGTTGTKDTEAPGKVFVHAFRGTRAGHQRLQSKISSEPLEAGAAWQHYSPSDFLLAAGHVGFSFDTPDPIQGFGPDVEEEFKSIDQEGKRAYQLFYVQLKGRMIVFPGHVGNDSQVFNDARGSGLSVCKVEYHVSRQALQKMKNSFRSNQPFPACGGYSFPGEETDIFPDVPPHLRAKGVAMVNNCATWPRQACGIPTPHSSGLLKIFIKAANELAPGPVDLRGGQ